MVVSGVNMPSIGWGFWILRDFKELSFRGPCEPCYFIFLHEVSKENIPSEDFLLLER